MYNTYIYNDLMFVVITNVLLEYDKYDLYLIQSTRLLIIQ